MAASFLVRLRKVKISRPRPLLRAMWSFVKNPGQVVICQGKRSTTMAQQEKVWYYAKGGQKFGPYSGIELRTIAQSGKISANDLIWKEGLAKWVPASSAKGLLPVTTPAVPPPLPQEDTSTTSQAAPLEGEKSFEKNATNHASPVSSPAFWNPLALSNWSFLLTPVFGSYLVAENYKSMGKAKEVKGAMEWFYISIAVMLAGLLLM